MAWHDLNCEIDNKKDYISTIRYKEGIYLRVKHFEQCFPSGLASDVQYRIITEKNFSALSMLDYVLTRYEPSELYLAIYRMNLPAVNRIKEIVTNLDCKFVILVSSFFRENKKYERWTRELEEFCKLKTNVELKFAWSHAKVFLCQAKCGRHFVFEGSGNLSDNARIEQYLIEDRIESYNFHKSWINETADRKRKGNDNQLWVAGV